MKVYDFLCEGDRRTNNYKIINAKMEEFKNKYGVLVGGKLRLDTTSNAEINEFCNMQLEEALKIIK